MKKYVTSNDRCDASKPSNARRLIVEGPLIDFFETGTEGLIWCVLDEKKSGREALEFLCEGDHLTVFDRRGRKIWTGTIRCDKRTGWRRYPVPPGASAEWRAMKLGQQCALGCWIHWCQVGMKPDAWGRLFIRPEHQRYRGVLRKKRGVRDPRLGPE